MYYYQKIFSNDDFANMLKIFTIFFSFEHIEVFIMKRKLEIEEKKEYLYIKFDVSMLDGHYELPH